MQRMFANINHDHQLVLSNIWVRWQRFLLVWPGLEKNNNDDQTCDIT